MSGPGVGLLLLPQKHSGGRARLEDQNAKSVTATAEEVDSPVTQLGGDPNARHQWLPPELELLRASDRNVLINALEAAYHEVCAEAPPQDHNTSHYQQTMADFKLDITRRDLEELIGRSTVGRLARIFEGAGHGVPPTSPGHSSAFNEVKLRRTEPVDQPGVCINFHTDFSERTMQLPLNGACVRASPSTLRQMSE